MTAKDEARRIVETRPWIDQDGAKATLIPAIEQALLAARAEGWCEGRDAAAEVAHNYWATASWHCEFAHEMEDLDAQIRALTPPAAGEAKPCATCLGTGNVGECGPPGGPYIACPACTERRR